jgi:hypothetical protein
MASLSRALKRIQQDCQQSLPDESILAACRAAGYKWRERKLGPVATIHLFILQVLWFNTAMTHLQHLAAEAVTAAAYCKARMRLPLVVLQQLLRDSSAAMRQEAGDTGLWCSLRVLLVDGSSSITPDTPALQKAFGQPTNQKKGCGFPVPKVLALLDAFTGLVIEMLVFPLFTHEQSQVWKLHPLLKRTDLILGDRGFCSYIHLAMLCARDVQACFRVHQCQRIDFRPHRKSQDQASKGKRRGRPTSTFVRRLGRHDQLVRWKKPTSRPKWISDSQWKAAPDYLEIRELRYTLPRRGQRTFVVTLATTLLDPVKYPREKLIDLYGMRWQVETHFAELKTTLKMRKLKSRTPAGTRKELAVYCLVYNLVHAIMLKAAIRQGVTPDRISFVDTIRWLLTTRLSSSKSASPGEELPDLLINPYRPGRHQPRVIKDLQDTYRKMSQPRRQFRGRLDLAKR